MKIYETSPCMFIQYGRYERRKKAEHSVSKSYVARNKRNESLHFHEYKTFYCGSHGFVLP